MGGISALFYDVTKESALVDYSKLSLIYTDFSFSNFLLRIICDTIIIVLALLCGLCLFSLPINYIILFYKGFLTVISIKFLILEYSAAGLLIGIFITIPSGLISAFSISLICAFSSLREYGPARLVRKVCIKEFLKEFLICFIISFFAIIYTAIINLLVFYPLNYYA